MFLTPLRVATLLAPLALAGCALPVSIADPEVARLARTIEADSASFRAALAAMPAPQCAYEQNKNFYDDVEQSARLLHARLQSAGAAHAAQRAGDALLRLAGELRASHQAASATLNDPHGACMAPGAIALNADAMARATRAIAAATLAGEPN